MPPESTSERTSSFVKNGLPSLAREQLPHQALRHAGPDQRLEKRAMLRDRQRTQRERGGAAFALEALRSSGSAGVAR